MLLPSAQRRRPLRRFGGTAASTSHAATAHLHGEQARCMQAWCRRVTPVLRWRGVHWGVPSVTCAPPSCFTPHTRPVAHLANNHKPLHTPHARRATQHPQARKCTSHCFINASCSAHIAASAALLPTRSSAVCQKTPAPARRRILLALHRTPFPLQTGTAAPTAAPSHHTPHVKHVIREAKRRQEGACAPCVAAGAEREAPPPRREGGGAEQRLRHTAQPPCALHVAMCHVYALCVCMHAGV